MPYTIRKLPKSKKYKVYNKKTKKVYSRGTTLKKAKAQVRFLNMMENKNIERNQK